MKSAVSASSVSRAFTDGLNLKDNFEEGGFFYAQKLLWFWMNVDQQARARCLFVSFLWLRADGIIICAIVSSASRCASAPQTKRARGGPDTHRSRRPGSPCRGVQLACWRH